MDECDTKPCPVGSRCVNTQGSFSCECPLGFDLEDGRTCTRGKIDQMKATSTNVTPSPTQRSCPQACYFTDSLIFPSLAKTFLGTFSVNRLPHDPIIVKSSTVHEIQREIIQLVRNSQHHRIMSHFKEKFPSGLRLFYLTTHSSCLLLSSMLRCQSSEVTAGPC